jgi:hypothetical protein
MGPLFDRRGDCIRYIRALIPWLIFAGGCVKPSLDEESRHYGPKVNLADFMKNTVLWAGFPTSPLA